MSALTTIGWGRDLLQGLGIRPTDCLQLWLAPVGKMNVWTRIKLAETAMPGPVGPHPPVTMNRGVPSTLPENCGSRGRLADKVPTAFTSSQPGPAGRSRRLSPSTTPCATRAGDLASARATRRSDRAIALRSNQPGCRP